MTQELSVGGHSHAPAATARTDAWWVEPLLVFLGLAAFIVYATWRGAFGGEWYWYSANKGGAGGYLSPFYSPLLYVDPAARGAAPVEHAWFGTWPSGWPGWLPVSASLFILPFPALFRFTCYFFRKAYYRSFAGSPPGCAVTPLAARTYRGETALLLFQNLHRYAMYAILVFIVLHLWDLGHAFFRGGRFGVGVGSVVLLIDVVLLCGYVFGCHSVRHLVGGRLDCFSSCGRARACHSMWRKVTYLNERHMLLAWTSLFWVAFTDFYVWMVSSGRFHDISTWGN